MPAGAPISVTFHGRPRTSVWADEQLLRELTIRQDKPPGDGDDSARTGNDQGGRGLTAQMKFDLDRYYTLLRKETEALALRSDQALTLYSALRSEWFDERGLELMPELFARNSDDRDLLTWLRNSSHLQRLLIADAIERVRSASYPDPDHDLPTRLRTVGLAKED